LQKLNWRCRQTQAETKTPEKSRVIAETEPKQWPLGNSSWRIACDKKVDSQPRLVMRNMRIGSFQDDQDSWPPVIDLEGFAYDRVGGLHGEGSADMRQRKPEEWIDWLARDRTFSPQPYSQLASVLLTEGRRDMADRILFAGRERERDEIWNRGDVSLWNDFWSWLWLTFLSGVAGYGIGLYTFRVLWWVIGLTVLGAMVLLFSPYVRQRGIVLGIIWGLGASLHRLLPIVELSKEFKDFFDNYEEPDKLRRWQMVFFAGIALAGWVLAFFLVAAMGGLIPK
jgi:hypothetical protein